MSKVQAQARGAVCYAPPITPDKLAAYKSLADAEPAGPVKEALTGLCEMVRVFQQTPRSKAKPVGKLTAHLADGERECDVVPLEEAEVKRIWDHVPWPHEVEGYRKLAKGLKPGAVHEALRHLIWYAAQLGKDREPLTQDMLRAV